MFLNIWPCEPATRRTQEEELHSVHTAVSDPGRRWRLPFRVAPLQWKGRWQPFSRERRQDTETKDWPPPKQTYPFEGTVLESSSPVPPTSRNATRWLSALGSHSNYVDFRRTSEREQTIHQIGKEQPSLRVCSRDLTIPRRDAPVMSWISTSYEKPVPKMPVGAYPFSKHTFESVGKTFHWRGAFGPLETATSRYRVSRNLIFLPSARKRLLFTAN